MEIFVTVLALAFLQIWGARNPLHKDGWFLAWRRKWIASDDGSVSEFKSFLCIFIPLILLVLIFALLLSQSVWLMLPFAVLVLLYSFGRGEFAEIVREYTQACYVEDWASATQRAQRFNVDVETVSEGDWSSLHKHVFDEAGYRGFERMFAVLFWFFLLGPVGAFMYRLVFLQATQNKSDSLAARWLWLIEWPAVRLLGLSFALTGNFSGCVNYLKECLFCRKRSTVSALSPMILGALSVSEELEADCEITRKELSLMAKLYQRTLWFWVACVSLIVIIA